jgi:hypothetical protein
LVGECRKLNSVQLLSCNALNSVQPEGVMKNQPPQHTPGPWNVLVTDESTFVRHGAGNHSDFGVLAEVFAVKDTRDTATVKANARLIAAAPDLLRSLKATLAAFKECVGADGWREFEENNAAVICAQGALIEAERR